MTPVATSRSARLVYRRRSVATWSLRLRPVWSLAPTSPAISVTRRSTAVWMSSSSGGEDERPLPPARLPPGRGRRGGYPPRRRPGCRPDPGRAHGHATRRGRRRPALVEGQADGEGHDLVGRAPQAALPQGHDRPPPCPARTRAAVGRPALAGRPGGHAQAPQPDEALGVVVAEGVGRVVGGETVVVEGHRAAPARPRSTCPARSASGPRRSRSVCDSTKNASSACLSGENQRPS